MYRSNSRKQTDINGNVIKNAMGYCNCEKHKGALNHELVKEHKCVAKRCKHLERFSDDAFRVRKYVNVKQTTKNKRN